MQSLSPVNSSTTDQNLYSLASLTIQSNTQGPSISFHRKTNVSLLPTHGLRRGPTSCAHHPMDTRPHTRCNIGFTYRHRSRRIDIGSADIRYTEISCEIISSFFHPAVEWEWRPCECKICFYYVEIRGGRAL